MLEDEHEQTQSDLRLAFKRIQDLQTIIEASVASDSDRSVTSSKRQWRPTVTGQ